MVFFESALALLLGLAFQLTLVDFLIEGLLLGAEHIGDELVADLLGVYFALDCTLPSLFAHLVVQHLLHLLLLRLLLRLLLSHPLRLRTHSAIEHLIYHLLL